MQRSQTKVDVTLGSMARIACALLGACLALSACGSAASTGTGDAGQDASAQTPDAGQDASAQSPDAGQDASAQSPDAGGELDAAPSCIPGDALDAGGLSAPEEAEPVLQPATWTVQMSPDYGHPNGDPEWGEVVKPAGDQDTAEFVIDYQEDPLPIDAPDGLYYEFQAEAVATSDRVVRFAWRYDGHRPWHSPQTLLRAYADGPDGRTEVSVFEGFTDEYPDLEGTVSLTLHAGYAFGLSVFDVGVQTLETTFTLTTLETRPLDAASPAPDPGAPTICPSSAPNQAPTLVLGPDLALDKDPAPYQSLRWAELAPGPASERGQTLSATLAITNITGPLTFDEAPTLDVATGDLHFATTKGTYGTATVEVTLRDDGGTDDGGADTTTGVFTIRVNSPPTDAHDINIKSPWKQEICIPFTIQANDADPLDLGWWEPVSYPSKGFFTWMTRPELIGGSPTYKYATTGCYMPFSSTWVGSDTFTFRVHDNHGGVTEAYSVSIEVFEL